MAEFINPSPKFPICDAVIYSGRILETVIVPIPDGAETPVAGGPAAEMHEIYLQLDEVLAGVGADRKSVVSVKLYLQNVRRDIAAVNGVYREYFGAHSPMRCGVGADLQAGMLVEAAFTCELPASQ
jgi:enamine deaminase RidA (YjgF/YER057c/UK114 family)